MTSAVIFRLFSLALVVVLVTCCFTVGSWMLDRVSREWNPAERLLLAIPLGCGAVASVILGIGAVGLLHGVALWAAVLVPGVAAWRHWAHLRPGLRQALEPLRGWSALSGSIACIVFGAVILLLALGALPPTTDWDSLMYHLEVPAEFLRFGRIVVPEDNLHVAYVNLWHMLYLPFLALGSSIAPALLNATVGVLLGLAVLAVGERLFGRTSAVLAFLALWGSPVLILVSATPRIDVVLALILLLATYVLISAAEEQRPKKVMVAAMLAGIAIGVKYHALLYLAVLLPVAIWAVLRIAHDNPRRLQLIGSCLLITIVATLPWLLKNWALVGAPLYPLFAERLLPRWLADLAGGTALPPDVATGTFQVLAQARESFSLAALLFNPASLTVEAEARAFTTSPAVLFLPVALVYVRCKKLAMLLVPGVGYVLLLIAASEFINLRYLVPALPPLMIVVAETARRLGTRSLDERVWRDILLLAAILLLLPSAKASSAELLRGSRAAAAVGASSEPDYLHSSGVPGFAAYYSATEWLSDYTRPDDRVLLLFEARGYYFNRDVLQDNDLTNWPLLLATSSQCLQESGITHVLVNHGAAAYYQRRGSDLRLIRWNTFPEFAARCLETVHTRYHYVLYRVRAARSAAARSDWRDTVKP